MPPGQLPVQETAGAPGQTVRPRTTRPMRNRHRAGENAGCHGASRTSDQADEGAWASVHRSQAVPRVCQASWVSPDSGHWALISR